MSDKTLLDVRDEMLKTAIPSNDADYAIKVVAWAGTIRRASEALTAKLQEKEAELFSLKEVGDHLLKRVGELTAEATKKETELEAAHSAIRTHPHGVFGDCRYNERAKTQCTPENCIWTRLQGKEPQ